MTVFQILESHGKPFGDLKKTIHWEESNYEWCFVTLHVNWNSQLINQ